jgi:hypothetical protein
MSTPPPAGLGIDLAPVAGAPAAPAPVPRHATRATEAAGFGGPSMRVRSIERLSPALAALLVQVVASAITLALYCIAGIAALEAPWTFWALVQAALAVLLATAGGQPQWWVLMHSLFAPAALLLDQFSPPPWIYLGCAALLAATNGNALRDRVPLFLTSRAARERLLQLLPAGQPVRFVDVGCGFGGVVATVGREHPTRECLGLETAWLPYLVSRLRCALSPNQATVARRDLWQHDLAEADVVYAYLSPVPMARLWRKVMAEMRPGALFISNSFAVPGVEPAASFEIDDATRSVLYVYRLPDAAAAAAASAEPIASSSEARS